MADIVNLGEKLKAQREATARLKVVSCSGVALRIS
jgi:hypothetical protein